MKLYTCNACLEGNHEKCELGYGAGRDKKGDMKIGGGRCICRCRGRNEKKWKADEEKDWKKYKKAVFSAGKPPTIYIKSYINENIELAKERFDEQIKSSCN